MIGLNRDLAPISEEAWERLEHEARDVLELHLAARKLVDFEGPLGWDHSAIDFGRVEPLEGVAIPQESVRLPDAVSAALEQLRQAGASGPYGVALGPDLHAALDRTAGEGGYPVLRHVQRLIDRPVVWAPSLRGGVVVTLRGGDFKLVCGRDASIGYLSHDDKMLRLYLEESFSAELDGPEAAVPLLAPDL